MTRKPVVKSVSVQELELFLFSLFHLFLLLNHSLPPHYEPQIRQRSSLSRWIVLFVLVH